MEKKTKSPPIIIHLSIMVLILIAILMAINFVILPKFTHHNDLIEVPPMIGLTKEEAIKIFTGKHLNCSFEESVTLNKKYPDGVIIAQSIKEREPVKEGRKILLTVNTKKSKLKKMPDLRNETLRNAVVVLENLDLTLGKINYKHDIAHNVVLEQLVGDEPILPGTEIPEKTAINIIVGLRNADELVTVPNLHGVNVNDIESKLMESNLILGTVTYEFKEGVDDGFVFTTYPEKNEKVPAGSLVNVFVAKSPD